jgi:signal transduction histidine kinase
LVSRAVQFARVVESTLCEIRARVLSAAVARAGAQEGLLFEPHPNDVKTACVTHATPGGLRDASHASLSTEVLMVRWLRVNRVTLALPESTGLWGSLPESWREWLIRRSVVACIPLIHEMKLVGWIFVCGGRPLATTDPRNELIESAMPLWAGALRAAQAEHGAAARAALVSRSNRLSLAGHLAASGAHEVRNSLSAVRSMVQLVLNKDVAPAEQDRLLTDVLSAVDRVNVGLSRTLALSRTRETSWTSIDVSQVVTDAATFCRSYAHRRRQVISVRHGAAAHVRGDQHELRQVLVNVLLNACQASSDGGTIEMEDDIAEPGYVSIVVRDQGAGMTPELMIRAFEPFYSTKQDGGGLGLAISRDIVRNHGGTIVLQSEVGTGTRVTIRLPLGDAHGAHSGR